MKKRVISHAIAVFIGMIIGYNAMMHNINYSIQFFGYETIDGNIFPKVKLLKKHKGEGPPYRWNDGPATVMKMVLAREVVDFDDEFANESIRQNYCKGYEHPADKIERELKELRGIYKTESVNYTVDPWLEEKK